MSRKIKTTITLASHIKDFASQEANALGLDFSAYITVLIAEKMRGPLIAPQINNTNNEIAATTEIKEKEVITIDSQQESEIDRLLEW